MTIETAQRIAANHNVSIETHDCCVLVLVDYVDVNGSEGIERIPATDIDSLRIALGY